MAKEYLFTSESVTEGHPDKICDQTSDAILDEVLRQDKNGRVACETLTTKGLIFIAGEITTKAHIDAPEIAREVLKNIGYTDDSYGFNYQTGAIITSIQQQSPEISQGVDTGGAGDQGMMFGYAVDETETFMPLPISLAHNLVMKMASLRKEKVLPYLRPDGKSQVTILYKDNIPEKVTSVVLAAQHNPDISQKKIKDDLTGLVINQVIPEKYRTDKMDIFINRTGSFAVGGPQADTGVTGRKIIVDTYGGIGSHGGGSFSGKDPSKVDRSASYYARYIAKNIVAAGLAKRCQIQIAYIIGQPQPVSYMLNLFGTGKVEEEKIIRHIKENLDLSPRGIINKLNLLRPIYYKTASYGHFGREDKDFTWEKTDLVDFFKELL
jgi:S-adenosylmethionine synthetase